MKQDMEKLLSVLSSTEAIKHGDELSDMIENEGGIDDELSELELDMVSAAAKPDYEKFKMFLNDKGIK